MRYDLVVRRARLHRRQEPVDIAIKDGIFTKITKIAADLSSDDAIRTLDAEGRLIVLLLSMLMCILMLC